MNNCKILSLTLAALIQASPALRLVFLAPRVANTGYAVISKWTVGLAALLGSYQAVSGASTVITSPDTATGKVGEAFSYRITTAPEQGNTFSAVPLPSGLHMGSGNQNSFILGTPLEAGTFIVTITASDDNKPDRTVSKDITIFIEPNGVPPMINSPPTDQTASPGDTVTFYVGATGTGPFAYQWKRNGEPLSNEINATFTLKDVQSADAGEYSVLVSNSAGSAESPPATLTVNGPPEILVAPSDQRVTLGNSATFTIGVAGKTPFTYQWLFNGQEIPEERSDSLTISNVQESNLGFYSVKVSNDLGEIASDPARLAIDYGVTESPVTLINVTDEWKYEQSGTNLGGAWHEPDYNDSSWPSGPALLYVENAGLPAPKNTPLQLGAITYYFRKEFLVEGPVENAALNLSTIIDDGAVFYLNGREIYRLGMPDGTISYLTEASRSVGDAVNEGPFVVPADALLEGANVLAVEVHQTSANSSDIVFGLELDAVLQIPNEAPAILSQPVGGIVNTGDNIILEVKADGTSPLSYQWQRNGADLSGQTASVLELTNIDSTQAGEYRVVVTNPFASVTSEIAVVEVIVPPSIQTQPQGKTVNEGDSILLEVVPAGTAPFSYQWQFNGNDLPGEHSSTLNIATIALDQAGIYTVTIQNSAGSVTSDPAEVIVNSNVSAPVQITNASLTNGNFEFSLDARTGQTYVIEFKDQLGLAEWTVLETITPEANQVMIFSDESSGKSSRFYRIRLVQP